MNDKHGKENMAKIGNNEQKPAQRRENVK